MAMKPRIAPARSDAERFLADLARVGGDPAAPLALAVSGGADSMAMLALAAEAMPGLVMAATVDHELRAGAAAEAVMVAEHCAMLDIPHATLRPTTPIAGASIQAQARTARYDLLAGWALSAGASQLATGHHADDQAETFLMRAARGCGLSGLAGVRPMTRIAGICIVRPLLEWRRAELRAIVRRRELAFVDDPTNVDDRHDRTRYRRLLHDHEWLDVAGIARSGTYLAEADTDMRAVVDWLWRARATTADGEVWVDVADLPREVCRRLARRAIGIVRDSAGIVRPDWSEGANIEALLDALADGRRATQAGVLASVRAGRWRFRMAPPRRTA